jgi:hypothetical protein
LCREPILFKKRHQRKGRSKPADLRTVDPSFARPTGQTPSGMPAAKAR